MTQVLVRQFVVQNQNAIGFALGALVLLTLAFDYFIGFGGENLIGLRLVYFGLMALLVGYIYTLSTNTK